MKPNNLKGDCLTIENSPNSEDQKIRTAEFFFPASEKIQIAEDKTTQDSVSDEKQKNRQTGDKFRSAITAAPFRLAKPFRIRTKDRYSQNSARTTAAEPERESAIKILPKTSVDLREVLIPCKLKRAESSTSLALQDAKEIQKNLMMKSRGLPFSRGSKTLRSINNDELNPLSSPIIGQSGLSFWPTKLADPGDKQSPRWRSEMLCEEQQKPIRTADTQKVASSYPTSHPQPTSDGSMLHRLCSIPHKLSDTHASFRTKQDGSLPRMNALEGQARKPIVKRQLNIVARIFGDPAKGL
jgi:hypothetical protein